MRYQTILFPKKVLCGWLYDNRRIQVRSKEKISNTVCRLDSLNVSIKRFAALKSLESIDIKSNEVIFQSKTSLVLLET